MATWITGTIPGVDEPVAVAYTEQENYGGNAWSASVVLRCPWEARYALIDNILINRLVWPYNPDSGMVAQGVSPAPMNGSRTEDPGGGQPMNAYGFADLTVTFGVESKEPGGPGGVGTALFSERIEPNGEMLKLPPESPGNGDDIPGWVFKWGALVTDKTLTVEEAPTLLMIGLDYVLHWTGLDAIPDGILDLVSHVNDDDIESSSLGITFPQGTLLFQSPVISRNVTSAPSENKFDLECRWSARPWSWNKFWDAKNGDFKEIWLHVEDESPVLYQNYPEADMSGLLP
jgi:hypothetical protein